MKTREICHGEAVREIVENCNSTRESIHAGEATAKKPEGGRMLLIQFLSRDQC